MEIRSTTILAVRRGRNVTIAGDGQVTFDDMIMKRGARKVRRLHKDQVIAGFAGAVADALTLFEKFERRIDEFQGNLARAALELAKEWRQDRMLRRLEALMIVADAEKTLVISGSGDVLEPDDAVIAIGSGAGYAHAAAEALYHHTDYSARRVAEVALHIAGSLCVYTNDQIVVEELMDREQGQ